MNDDRVVKELIINSKSGGRVWGKRKGMNLEKEEVGHVYNSVILGKRQKLVVEKGEVINVVEKSVLGDNSSGIDISFRSTATKPIGKIENIKLECPWIRESMGSVPTSADAEVTQTPIGLLDGDQNK